MWGPAIGLILETVFTGSEAGVTSNITDVPTIQPDKKHTIHVPVTSDRFTENGTVTITIEVTEPNGFSPAPFAVEVETRAFEPPSLEVVDFACTADTWEANTPISLDVLIQNVGVGSSELSIVELIIPSAINCYSDNKISEPQTLASGESRTLSYDMIVPRSYLQRDIQVEVVVSEKYGDYGSTWSHLFPFKNDTESKVIPVKSVAEEDKKDNVQRVSLNKSSGAEANVSFNQVPKDIIVETVAVMPIDGKDCDGEIVSGQDIASFTEGSLLGLYNVVERRNLERVLDEQRLALSGILYEKSAVEAGCNVGAQGIIFTEYGCLTGQETIQLKLVDCQTSELYWSATGVNATAQETLDKVRQELEGMID